MKLLMMAILLYVATSLNAETQNCDEYLNSANSDRDSAKNATGFDHQSAYYSRAALYFTNYIECSNRERHTVALKKHRELIDKLNDVELAIKMNKNTGTTSIVAPSVDTYGTGY